MMTTSAQLSVLMSEVQERLNLEVTSHPAAEGVWNLALDPLHPIRVRFDPDRDKVVFMRSIGTPPDGNQAALHEICLVINHNWHDTAGLGIGLDGPTGAFVGFQDIAVGRLNTETLTDALAAFEFRAQALGELVRRRPEAPAEAISDTALSMLGMRV